MGKGLVLLAVLLVGVLAGGGLVVAVGGGALAYVVNANVQNSRADLTRLSMSRLAQRIEIHQLRNDKVPSLVEGLAVVFPDGVPKDAWDNDYVYVTPGPDGHAFDLISFGADGAEGGSGNNADIRHSEWGN